MGHYPVKFGKYLLLDRINVGGMAEVFKAKTFGVAGFERILAIKRILPSLVEDDEFIRMFIDEARIAVQLNHANIVQIYELGKHGEHYYIAMEYLPSRDLRAILDKMRSHGQLMPIPQAAYVISKVCEGLDYAHRRRDPSGQPMNIIHRDVSPQNVLITYEGEIKVIDFGIAKAANRASKTQAGVLKGKFGYMSPEQVRGLPIDRRSDIFAVGVLLYEMLTGERLFIGESDFSTLERVRNAEVIPPTTFNKKISPELEQIVLKSLAREQEDRYQWASDLAEDLQRFLIEDRSIYSAKRLAAYMKETYASEIGSERAKMEEYLQIGVDEIVPEEGSGPLSRGAPAARVEPPELDPVSRPPQPPPASPSDGIDYDIGDEFEEDKTFVIESSDAGLALQPSAPTSAGPSPMETSQDVSGRQPRLTENTNDDFLDDASLYGEDDLELEDDAKTMVSVSNPFDEGHTDERPQSGRDSYAPSLPSAAPRSAVSGPVPMAAAGASLEPVRAAAVDEPTATRVPGVGSMTGSGAVLATPSLSGAGAALDVDPSGPTARAPRHSGAGPAAGTDIAGPQLPVGTPVPLPPSGVAAEETEPKSPVSRPPALSPGMRYGLIGGVAATFLLFVVLLGLLISKMSSSSGSDVPSLVVSVLSPSPAPAGLKVLLDGQEISSQVPVQIPLPGGLAHVLTVTADGHQPVDVQVPPLQTGQVLQLPVELNPAPASGASGGAKPDPGSPGAEPATGAAPAVAATPDEAPMAGGGERWRVSLTAVAGGASIHGARVFHSGRLLGLTPFEGEFPGGIQRVALEVRADGYAVKQVDLQRAGRDHVGPAAVKLVKAPEGVPTPVEAAAGSGDEDEAATGAAGEGEGATAPAPAAAAADTESKPDEPTAGRRVEPKPAGADKPRPSRARAERGDDAPRRSAARSRSASKRKDVTLALGTRPYARVWVDGRRLDRTTPLMGDRALKLRPGDHVFQFLDEKTEQKFRYKISIPSGSDDNKIIIILGKKVMVKEGKAKVQLLK